MSQRPTTILIPTTDLQRAEKTAQLAAITAGVPNLEIDIIIDEGREGFTATVNKGLRRCEGAVCLLNDDAVPLTERWLALLRDEMDRRSALRVWFAGPSGPCRTAPQNGGRVGDRRRPRLVNHLAGFCLLVKAEAVEVLGGLDERFRHYGSDVDWQRRARRDFGARSLWVPGCFVKHELHPPRQPWWDEDQKLLEEIWR